jgi:hypothetical protein
VFKFSFSREYGKAVSLIFVAMKAMKFYFCLFFLVITGIHVSAQQDSSKKAESTTVSIKTDTTVRVRKPVAKPDSTVKAAQPVIKPDTSRILNADSLALTKRTDSLRKDSTEKAIIEARKPKIDTSTYGAILPIARLPFGKNAVFIINDEHKSEEKDELFYILAGVAAFLGFIKVAFPRYFKNIFSIFFQTSFRQKQTREQLAQDSWPSLFTNLLFVISVSIYASLILLHKDKVHMNFWLICLYCAVTLVVVYTGKFLFLKFSGWVFNVQEASRTYIFVVFLTNKIIGVLLLPFLLILAFSGLKTVDVAITVSVFVLGGMVIYRYVVSLGTIRNTLKVSGLHFFLYLCAIEVLPLLLMYKAVFNYIETSI